MSTTESALPATPVTPELDTGVLTDAQMLEIFGDEYTPTTAEPVTTAVPAETEKVPEPETEELLDSKALEALDTPEVNEPGTAGKPPASDPFIEKLTTAIPNDVALSYAVNAYNAQTAFEAAVAAGNLGDAIRAMPVAKQFFAAALAQTQANPEFERQVVENYIKKHSPENQNPVVDALQAEVNTLKQRFATEDAAKQTAAQQDLTQKQLQARANAVTAIDTELVALFDKVRFTRSDADRRVVSAMFKLELAKSPVAMNKALAGDLTVLRPIFREVAGEFATNEKAKMAQRGSTPKTAAPILTGAGVATETAPKGLDGAYARAAQYVASTLRK